MIPTSETRELFSTMVLIGGFSLAGLFVSGGLQDISFNSSQEHNSQAGVGMKQVTFVASPVVHISLPEHNVFTSY